MSKITISNANENAKKKYKQLNFKMSFYLKIGKRTWDTWRERRYKEKKEKIEERKKKKRFNKEKRKIWKQEKWRIFEERKKLGKVYIKW